jgi:putative holliday junction resolvase
VIPRVEIVKEIKKLISEKHISDIVIGLPYINSGLSNQALKIQEFSKKILETFPMIRLHFIDERFTSLIPKKELISQDPIDMISAQMLLETFLSRKK